MMITDTFKSLDISERLARQAAIHRRCILLLRALHAEEHAP